MAVQTNEDVAAKVRGVAAERRITQAQIATHLSISKMAVSRRYSGQTPFTPAELIRLAALFDAPVGAFFGETPALVSGDAA